jgi:hypothetical protein
MTMLATIAGGLAMAFSTSLRTAAAIRQRAELADEQRALTGRLQADLQGAWLRPGSQWTWFRGGQGIVDPGSTTNTGDGVSLELTTTRPVSTDAVGADEGADGASGPQSDVSQVSWRLEPDTDGSLALVRRERIPPDPNVDEAQDPAVVRTVMSHAVTTMTVRCFDGTEWLDQWDTTSESDSTSGSTAAAATPTTDLPRAVEVALYFASQPTRIRLSQPMNGNAADPSAPHLTFVVALPGSEEAVAGQSTTGGTTP